MAPSAIVEDAQALPVRNPAKLNREPLKSSGSLDQLESIELTPIIGTEFKEGDLAAMLRAPNSDELIRDLAIKISQRCVVFFRKQDNLTNDLQKELIHRLGLAAGKPKDSTLHIHPILNPEREGAPEDPEISIISSKLNKKVYKDSEYDMDWKRQKTAQWHSDIAFEPVPADYTALRLVELPKTGGDTLWASGYELYDKLSTPYQKMLEGLTATFGNPFFETSAKNGGFELYAKQRGSPGNVGSKLHAVHPVVRTNPVTGWKSIFPVGGHTRWINDLSEQESRHLLDYFVQMIYQCPEVQVRHRWHNENDIAIWDNRSTFHSATFDYSDQGDRSGCRAVGIGERPYYDPNSSSRREALIKAEIEANRQQ